MAIDDGFVLERRQKQPASVVEIDLATALDVFDRITADVYYDTHEKRFRWFGSDGTDRDPKEWRNTRITIEGHHPLAVALAQIIRDAIKAIEA